MFLPVSVTRRTIHGQRAEHGVGTVLLPRTSESNVEETRKLIRMGGVKGRGWVEVEEVTPMTKSKFWYSIFTILYPNPELLTAGQLTTSIYPPIPSTPKPVCYLTNQQC